MTMKPQCYWNAVLYRWGWAGTIRGHVFCNGSYVCSTCGEDFTSYVT